MDDFTEINMDTWPRAEEYGLFTRQWTTICYTVTLKQDVTDTVTHVKEKGFKFVPAVLWLITRELNAQENFRLAVRDGKLGVWDQLHPMYPTINRTGNMTFHSTAYRDGFSDFHQAYLAEAELNRNAAGIFASTMPENSYVISVVPYMSFENVSFHLKNAKNYYAPIFDIGKYRDDHGRLLMPVSVTVNHAAADLSHVNALFKGLQNALYMPESWCR